MAMNNVSPMMGFVMPAPTRAPAKSCAAVIALSRYARAVADAAELLQAHLAAIDLSAAPSIELSLAGLADTDTQFTIEAGALQRGPAPAPAFSVTAHWADVLDLIEGFGSIEAALVDGRVKIAGDLVAALRWVPILFSPTGSKPRPASSSRGS
jgi:hypothetical protein